MRSLMMVLITGLLLALVSCDKKDASSPSGGGQSSQLRIAVIPKGTTHEFWKSVHAGADKAGQELGVQILWKGPLQENDRAQQIQIVEQLISDNYSALCLAPLDDKALIKPVQEAAGKKIPVIIFDSGLKGDVGKDFASFVATDNHKGGTIAGTEMVRILGGKGKVILLRYQEGSASTAEREDGFLEIIKQNPGIQLISDNRYAGATVDTALTASMNMIDQLRQADAVFCPNESATVGMLNALTQAGLAGKLKVVGFDASQSMIKSMEKGDLQATVIQNPVKMGYLAVKTAVAVIKGQPVEQRIDTGVSLVTKDNLNSPDIQAMLGR
ncbi:MAG TPA: substrate-binding domain-containing protein [Humisphaera sp.]|jgi:ribose transport system substrate-binding protein|nr:substrate-binding domain-containing protein [Humisphaera sp.]